MSERRPGRPTLLTPERGDELVRLVAAGVPLRDAARAVGVSERAVRGWRARAWSSRPADAAHVALEVRLQRALGAAAARRNAPPLMSMEAALAAVEPWEQAAARLERGWPRWRLPGDELDDE